MFCSSLFHWYSSIALVWVDKSYNKLLQIPPAGKIHSLHHVPFQAQKMSWITSAEWNPVKAKGRINSSLTLREAWASAGRAAPWQYLISNKNAGTAIPHLSFPGFTQQKQAEHAIKSKRSPPQLKHPRASGETPSFSTLPEWVRQHWKAVLPARGRWVK